MPRRLSSKKKVQVSKITKELERGVYISDDDMELLELYIRYKDGLVDPEVPNGLKRARIKALAKESIEHARRRKDERKRSKKEIAG